MTGAEVEARRFEHEPLEADDTSSMRFENLAKDVSLPWLPESQWELTGLSGDICSDGGSFRLYAAHTISRDFLRVSSILHAVNRAAAAASYQSRQHSSTAD